MIVGYSIVYLGRVDVGRVTYILFDINCVCPLSAVYCACITLVRRAEWYHVCCARIYSARITVESNIYHKSGSGGAQTSHYVTPPK